jgi:hypothetical protein
MSNCFSNVAGSATRRRVCFSIVKGMAQGPNICSILPPQIPHTSRLSSTQVYKRGKHNRRHNKEPQWACQAPKETMIRTPLACAGPFLLLWFYALSSAWHAHPKCLACLLSLWAWKHKARKEMPMLSSNNGHVKHDRSQSRN